MLFWLVWSNLRHSVRCDPQSFLITQWMGCNAICQPLLPWRHRQLSYLILSSRSIQPSCWCSLVRSDWAFWLWPWKYAYTFSSEIFQPVSCDPGRRSEHFISYQLSILWVSRCQLVLLERQGGFSYSISFQEFCSSLNLFYTLARSGLSDGSVYRSLYSRMPPVR